MGVALSIYVKKRKDIPVPSPLQEGQVLIPVPLIVAAKLTLYTAMREQGLTNVALAARLGLSEGAVRRLVNPLHRSHISQVEKGPEGRWTVPWWSRIGQRVTPLNPT